MTLTLRPILLDAGIDLEQSMVIRHAYVARHEDSGLVGINRASLDSQILEYTGVQSAKPRVFPAQPPRYWVVFLPEGGDRARLWAVLENRGEIENDGILRRFDVHVTEQMSDLQRRLVISWPAPRSWWIHARTAAQYPVFGIADAEAVPFPGFGDFAKDFAELRAVLREPRYSSWQTALASVVGVYLITDLSDGRQYVGKADGAESIRQRWDAYITNGHGGNVELRGRDSSTFRFSLLRVFDPSTPSSVVNAAESHFKHALATKVYGLNRN